MEAISGNTGLNAKAVRTNIPARLDRLPWSRWHWLVVVSLGITWILDGLEVTIVGSIAAVLTDKRTLHLSDVQVASAGTIYLVGAVLGALLMAAAGLVEILFGVNAERKSLESIAQPLSAIEEGAA